MVAGRILELYQKGGLCRVKGGLVDFVRYRAKENFAGPIGRLVELAGDRVSYHSVVLDLSDPVISTRLKARFPLGLYEDSEVGLIEEQLPDDKPVVELGGGIGFISCFTDSILNDVKHVVVEANPKLVEIIETNRALNDASFDIRHSAYQSSGEETDFYVHEKFVGGSVQRTTDRVIRVDGESLEEILDSFEEKITLIVDIEGGEFDLFENEMDLLVNHCSHLFIEFHEFTDANIEQYEKELVDLGFALRDRRDDVRFYKATSR